VEDSERLQRVIADTNRLERKPNSSIVRVNYFSYFECFMLVKLKKTAFARFLRTIKDPSSTPEKVRFVKPNRTSVQLFVAHMREYRKNKCNSILNFLCSLSMTSLDCGGGMYDYGPDVEKMIKTYRDEDKECRAPAFHPEELLPALWRTIFEETNSSHNRKVFLWTRILVQLATISRSSDISWEKGKKYCPLVKDLEFPKDKKYYRPDGMPTWIILKWTDWKGRPANQKKEPFASGSAVIR